MVNKVYCQSRYRPYLQYYGTEDLQGTDRAYTKKGETLNFADSRKKTDKTIQRGLRLSAAPFALTLLIQYLTFNLSGCSGPKTSNGSSGYTYS